MSTTSIFFNQSFDKKKLKTFIYWVLKTFGEKKALTIVEELKRMGFSNATKAGLSIGLHDLKTPLKKRSLISRAQITMNKTDREFQGAELTATERSQRIVDTWHRTSEDLRKQVVDYFSMYDQLNSVYMMASSGARGNFSQVRQLIGMRGLMADPQGQIISFPIRSNLREGLTLTEYFISCSGARKGLVDTALRTADTGYLTRRLVDISHHIVVKKVTCYTSRGIALKTLRTSQKVLLSLKDRLVGRVLGENIYDEREKKRVLANPLHLPDLPFSSDSSMPYKTKFCMYTVLPEHTKLRFVRIGQLHLKAKLLHRQQSLINTKGLLTKTSLLQNFVMQKRSFGKHKHEIEQNSVVFQELGQNSKTSVVLLPQRTYSSQKQRVGSKGLDDISFVTSSQLYNVKNTVLIAKKNQEISPDLAFKISLIKTNISSKFATKNRKFAEKNITTTIKSDLMNSAGNMLQIQQDSSSSCVLVRSPLTCAYTHEVCQLCYGWSMAQGSLVSLGEAVGVIAGQSIGEPGTQLTMRTFHTGGVFSGDLLQEIRAPHSGKIVFPQALQGLLIRTSQGKIAFLIKVSGELLLDNSDDESTASTKINDFSPNEVVPKIKDKLTKISLEPSTILFVRQGQKVQNNQILAELAITSEEGNQPVKSRQTLFSEITGRIIQWKSLLCRPLGKTSKNICNFIVTPKIDKDRKKLAMQKPSDTKNKLFKNDILHVRACTKTKFLYKQSFYSQEVFPAMQGTLSSGAYSLRLKYDSQNRSDVDHNFLLKQIVLSKKHGFGCLEPPKALQLGLLSVIATRVGASESLSTTTKKQSIISNNAHSKQQVKIDLRNHLLSLSHLNTIAEQGDLVDENYIQM